MHEITSRFQIPGILKIPGISPPKREFVSCTILNVYRSLLFPFCLLLVSGCGGGPEGPALVPVSGKVAVDGKAVVGATVTFHPKQSGLNPSIGTTGEDGTYELVYSSQKGAVPGEYKVTVSYFTNPDGTPFQQTDEGMDIVQMEMQGKVKESLPAKYTDPQQTELSFTVPDGGTSEAHFHLTTH